MCRHPKMHTHHGIRSSTDLFSLTELNLGTLYVGYICNARIFPESSGNRACIQWQLGQFVITRLTAADPTPPPLGHLYSFSPTTVCSQPNFMFSKTQLLRGFSILADYFHEISKSPYLLLLHPTMLLRSEPISLLTRSQLSWKRVDLYVSRDHFLAIKWPSFPTYKNGQIQCHFSVFIHSVLHSCQNRTTNTVQERDVWLSSSRHKNGNHRKCRMSQLCDALKLMWS